MRLEKVRSLMTDTVNDWLDDRAMSLAAALAFYAVLSLAPLLVVAVSVAGLVFGEAAARGEISQQFRTMLGPEAGAAIEGIVVHAKEPHASVIASVIGVVVLLFGASGVFGELQDSLNAIWRVKPKPGRGVMGVVKARFFSFAMVLGVAFLLLVSLLVSAALSVAGKVIAARLPGGEAVWIAVNFAISFAVVSLLFALIFKVVPDAKISWRDVGYGAAFTALLFTIGKALIGIYLGHAGIGSPYGAAGSLVVLVVWVYYSAQIMFLGAEFTQVYARMFGSCIRPGDNAVTTARPGPGDAKPATARPDPGAATARPDPDDGPPPSRTRRLA